jgi:hypothetical protein
VLKIFSNWNANEDLGKGAEGQVTWCSSTGEADYSFQPQRISLLLEKEEHQEYQPSEADSLHPLELGASKPSLLVQTHLQCLLPHHHYPNLHAIFSQGKQISFGSARALKDYLKYLLYSPLSQWSAPSQWSSSSRWSRRPSKITKDTSNKERSTTRAP